jgi:hypothetical protein
MKTMKYKIGSLFLIIGLFSISLNSFSQEKELSRKEKKEVRKAQLTANFYLIDSLLRAKTFVLEADFLQNRYGDRVVVSPNINFIKLDDSTGILQTGSTFNMGYNGVGGVTAEGTIGRWKIYRNEKTLTFRLQFSLFTNLGTYDISMVIGADTKAKATITGLTPGSLTWDGNLVAIENSRVFKGRTPF